MAAAGELSAPEPVGAAHVTAALLTEPEGVAAKAIAAAGLSPEQVYTAIGAGPAPQVAKSGSALKAWLLQLEFDDDAKRALKDSLSWALRLGHNYIGTEHLLLGVAVKGGPASEALTGLGLPAQRAEQLVVAELAAIQARKAAN
jgi:ATP-dependent Clp protease ATP-binding subunit ClpA